MPDHSPVDELSSGSDDRRSRPRLSPRLRAAAVTVVVLVLGATVGVRTVSAHREHDRQHQRLDHIDVSVEFGSEGSSFDAAGKLVSASVEILVGNHGKHPIDLDRPQVQMPGVSVVSWAADTRRVPVGATVTMRLIYAAKCPVSIGPVPRGRLVVVLRSATGDTHRLTKALSGDAFGGDPFTREMDQICGALGFAEALNMETVRVDGRSAVLNIQNRGRTTMRLRALAMTDKRFVITAHPALPLAIPPMGSRRAVLTFGVHACGHHRLPSELDLVTTGDNDEPGTSSGSPALQDDRLTRLLRDEFRDACG